MMTHSKDNRIILSLFSVTTVILIVMHICPCHSNVMQNPVYRVTNCPQNDTEWKKASRRLNCTDDDAKPVNKYHCLPNSELSTLLEFCYSETRTLVEEGNCMQLVPSIHILNNYKCDKFDIGCPEASYFSDNTYNYQECLEIDPENHCYLAEPSCKTTTSKFDSRYTISSSYGETSSNSSPAENSDGVDIASIIIPIIIIFILLIAAAIFVGRHCWRRKRRQQDITEKGAENTALLDRDLDETIANEIDSLKIDFLLKPLPNDTTLYPAIAKRLNIPREILFWTSENIKQFVNSIKTGSICVFNGRGMVIGCAEAGKTTLVKKLKGEKDLKTSPTRGIEIHTHVFKLDEKESIIIACKDIERKAACLSLTPATVALQEETKRRSLRRNSSKTLSWKVPQEIKSHLGQKTVKADIALSTNVESCEEKTPTHSVSVPESLTDIIPDSSESEHDVDSQKSLPDVDPSKCSAFVSNDNFKMLSILDFAGQSAYYACHHIFFSPRAFYILVVDISKNLEDKAENACERPDLIYSNWTYADYVRYWLGSIHTYSSKTAPVILIASHSEHIEKHQKKKKLLEYFHEIIRNLPENLRGHLNESRAFSVEKLTTENMKELQKCIVLTLKSQSHWGESVPLAWAKLESVIRKLQENLKIILFLNLFELIQRAEDIAMKDKEEFVTALRFFHETGLILFRREIENIIILDVQWFVNAFKNIIMDERHIETGIFSHMDTLNDLGLLSGELLQALWKNNGYEQHRTSLIAHMKHLGMLAEIDQTMWYVPCMNKQKYSDKILQNCEVSSTLCFLFDYLPLVVYHRLVVSCINKLKWSIWKKERECIFHTVTVLEHNLNKTHRILIGVCENKVYSKRIRPYSIEIQVFVTNPRKIDTSLCSQIKKSLEQILNSLTRTFPMEEQCFEIGYRCLKRPFTDNPETHIILEEEMNTSELDCSQCSPVQPVAVMAILGFWENSKEGQREKEQGIPHPVIEDKCVPKKMRLLPFLQQSSTISIPNVYNINHISLVSSDKIWLSDRKHIMEIDHSGHILQSLRIDDIWGSASHTVDKNENILFIKNEKNILRVDSDGREETLLTLEWTVLSIYSSHLNEDILLGIYILIERGSKTRLARYTKDGQLLSEIEYYDDKRLYVSPLYLSENINGDVCTADIDTCLVKAIDRNGVLRFSYDGQPHHTEFFPTGICNDMLGHVLVCNRHDSNPSVHILDMDGMFLSIILTERDGVKDPWGLCVDSKGMLYIGQHDCKEIKVYKYLQEN